MQQVAAINSDIASPGIHANNASQQSSDGMGDEFAQFLNSSNQQSGSEFRGHENRSASSVQSPSQNNGAEAQKTTQADKQEQPDENNEAVEKSTTAEDNVAQPQVANKEASEETGESTSEKRAEVSEQVLSNSEGSAGAEQSSEEDPHHDQWISILQQLNSGASSDSEVSETTQETDIDIQHTGATDEQKQMMAETEANQETIEEVSSLEMWKQELRDKMLNFTGELNINQRKDMEKKLADLSEEEIQQLLNDDQSVRNLASTILHTEQPDPRDVALLLALAEQNLDNPDTSVPVSDVTDENIATENTGAEAEGAESDELSESETISVDGDNSEEAESVEAPEVLLSDVQIDEVDVEIKDLKGEGELPGPIPQPEVSLTGSSDSVTANSKATDEQVVKPEALDMKQLLSDLEQNLNSPEEKVLAVENLTKRIESADVGKTPAGQKFLESLKNTLQEYKSQLKDGHEPAINLNKMVTDAMVGDSVQVDAVALENQMKQALQQMVNVAQAHQSLDPGARESLLSTVQSGVSANALTRESNASQVELAKTQQAQNQAQIMDKAVNILKPEAAQDLANKVQVMMSQRNMVADIRLDPPDLGQMQIKITMQGDSASVSMVVQSQAAREALEHNQPRLKELLEQQGIELGQSSVREEGRGETGQGENGEMASGGSSTGGEDTEGNDGVESFVTVDEPEGIDYFA